MSDLKAAVIGTGGAAQLHLDTYRTNPHTRPVAVVSNNRARADEIAAEFSVRGYTSVQEMLDREQPDIISVATLEWDHELPVLQALDAGAHVLCEKIMAHEIAIGERMLAAAHRAGRTLGVNYNYRSVPSHQLIRDGLHRGAFGKPALFTANMHAYLWPHLLDLLRCFFGDPVEVSATIVDNQALRPAVSVASGRPWVYSGEMLYHPSIAVAANFRFAKPDFVATMSGSALIPLEQNFWSFALIGTEDAVTITAATRANLNGAAGLGSLAQTIAALPRCSYAQSFELSVGSFIDAIRSGAAAPVTGEDGLAAMRLDAAIVQAANTGRTVRFAR